MRMKLGVAVVVLLLAQCAASAQQFYVVVSTPVYTPAVYYYTPAVYYYTPVVYYYPQVRYIPQPQQQTVRAPNSYAYAIAPAQKPPILPITQTANRKDETIQSQVSNLEDQLDNARLRIRMLEAQVFKPKPIAPDRPYLLVPGSNGH